MPSSTAWISCSRETCFSALSWRRAPTKSRLTAPPRCTQIDPGPTKRNVGVTHVVERPFSCRKYTQRAWTAQPRGSVAERDFGIRRGAGCRSSGPSARSDDRTGCGGISPLDVRLEDVDELVDESLAAERPVEPAIDEDRRHRIL